MHAPRRRGWVFLVALALSLAPALPATAHTDLVSTNPADGQTVDNPPEQLRLRFAEDMLDGGARVVARDDEGVDVAVGSPRVDGSVLTASWPSSADAGRYTVAWRAVSDDGHPLEGQFVFTIRAQDAPSEQPSAQESELPVQPVSAEEPQTGVNLVLPGLLIVVVAAVGFFVWRSRAD
jgi:methionine-rich copper-binding protein CopC